MSSFPLVVALLFTGAPPAAGEPPAKASPSEVERLLRQLGSDDFARREAAAKALQAVGEPALEALARAASDGENAEARRRARDLLRAIEGRVYGEVRCLWGPRGAVTCVAFSPDGRQVLAAGRGGSILRWDAATGREQQGFRYALHQTAISPDARRAVTSPALGGRIILHSLESRGEPLSLGGHTGVIDGLAFSPDGKRVLSGGADGTVRLWDADRGKALRRFVGHKSNVLAVGFSPDGKQALTGGVDGTARLWDVASGRELRQLRGQNRSVLGVAVSPDGRRAVTCGTDVVPSIRLLDLELGREVRRFGPAGVCCVAFSPDGRRVLSGGPDGSVCLWDVETGKNIVSWTKHEKEVLSVAFSPDGRLAVSGGVDFSVRLWRLPK